MYMTITDMHKKLGEIISGDKETEKTIVLGCYIIEPEDQSNLPDGSIVFTCLHNLQSLGEEYVKYIIYPDQTKTLQ